MQNIIHIEYSIHNASLSITPYYEITYGLIKKVIHLEGFPIIPKKNLYNYMLHKESSESSYGEENYPTFNWKSIWKNFTNILFYPYEKEIIYKHLHLCLATNHRLAMLGRNTTGLCNKCSDDVDQTPVHMFYQCENVKPLFLWLLRSLFKISNFRPTTNIRFLYFDANYDNPFQRTICNTFLYIYIITIWKTRKENLRIGILKTIIVKRLSDHFNFMKLLPNNRLDKVFEKFSRLDIDSLINL